MGNITPPSLYDAKDYPLPEKARQTVLTLPQAVAKIAANTELRASSNGQFYTLQIVKGGWDGFWNSVGNFFVKLWNEGFFYDRTFLTRFGSLLKETASLMPKYAIQNLNSSLSALLADQREQVAKDRAEQAKEGLRSLVQNWKDKFGSLQEYVLSKLGQDEEMAQILRDLNTHITAIDRAQRTLFSHPKFANQTISTAGINAIIEESYQAPNAAGLQALGYYEQIAARRGVEEEPLEVRRPAPQVRDSIGLAASVLPVPVLIRRERAAAAAELRLPPEEDDTDSLLSVSLDSESRQTAFVPIPPVPLYVASPTHTDLSGSSSEPGLSSRGSSPSRSSSEERVDEPSAFARMQARWKEDAQRDRFDEYDQRKVDEFLSPGKRRFSKDTFERNVLGAFNKEFLAEWNLGDPVTKLKGILGQISYILQIHARGSSETKGKLLDQVMQRLHLFHDAVQKGLLENKKTRKVPGKWKLREKLTKEEVRSVEQLKAEAKGLMQKAMAHMSGGQTVHYRR